jgi:flagellar FliL protein
VFYQLENVVVNPAGSEGLRFLMVTVALELRDAKALTRMGEQEVRVRDAVVAVLERQSLEMLTGPGARDSLRSRLMAAVAPLADGALLRVYLPQFVIQ